MDNIISKMKYELGDLKYQLMVSKEENNQLQNEHKKEVEELLERSKSIKPTLKDRMDSARVVATVGAVPLSPLLAQDAGDNTRSLLGRR